MTSTISSSTPTTVSYYKDLLDDKKTQIIILICCLVVIVFMIYKQYKTQLDPKSYITMIYMYIMFAMLFVAAIGRYMEGFTITDKQNSIQMIVIYFILAFGGISLMVNDSFFMSHFGFLLMLIALSLIVGSSFRYSSHIMNAAVATAVIVLVLSLIVFNSSIETLMKMKDWLSKLLFLLIGLIIIEILILIFYKGNPLLYKIMSLTSVFLFSFFVLSDTSRLIIDSRTLTCQVHYCINYPLKSSALMLDYINIFINLLNNN